MNKAMQPTTGTVHYATTAQMYGNTHVVSACSTMSMATNRCSLSLVDDSYEVTCRKCLAGHAAANKPAPVAIADADGSALKDGHGYVLKTVVAARNELSHQVQNIAWYGDDDSKAHAARIAAALTAEGSVDVAKVIANATKKARKEGAAHPVAF